MAKIDFRIDGSPNELRRLIGQPDLLPLYQVAALALERWLVRQIWARAPSHRQPSAKPDDRRTRPPRRGR